MHSQEREFGEAEDRRICVDRRGISPKQSMGIPKRVTDVRASSHMLKTVRSSLSSNSCAHCKRISIPSRIRKQVPNEGELGILQWNKCEIESAQLLSNPGNGT